MPELTMRETYELTDRLKENLKNRSHDVERIGNAIEGFVQMVDEFYGPGDLRARAGEAVDRAILLSKSTAATHEAADNLRIAIDACLELS